MRNNGPLSDVRVVEMGGIGPGPYAGLLLADYGADIVRVARRSPEGQNAKPSALERSRPYITLDAKDVRDREVLASLIAEADVLIEGFRPGVMERLGLGPDDCFKLNSGLVYGRVTGWGQSGPLVNKAGHDLNFLAVSGALSTFGPKDGPPTMPLNLVADYAGGSLFLIIGILLSLRVAASTGHGQVVDAAMLDGVASLMTATAGMRARGDWIDRRESNFLDGGAPFNRTYVTSDERYVAVAAIEPEFWRRFLVTVGAPDLRELDQWDKAQWSRMTERLGSILSTRTRDEWVEIFAEVDCCFTPVLSLSEAPLSSHAAARGIYEFEAGFPCPRSAPVLSGAAARHRHSAEESMDANDVLTRWRSRRR